MYEKLQDILNKAIEKGWKPFKLKNDYTNWFTCYETYILLTSKDSFLWIESISYHDLFSKDSGLMEAVKRHNWDNVNWKEITPYQDMWPMTATEKVQYFLDNIQEKDTL